MTISTVHRHEPVLAYPLVKQADVATVVPPASITKAARLKNVPLYELNTTVLDDAERFARGIEWAKEQKVERYDLAMSLELDLDPNTAAWLMALALNDVTSAQQGVTEAYEHIIVPFSTEDSKELPVTTLALQRHPDQSVEMLRAMAVNGFEVSMNVGDERLSMKADLIGSGEAASGTLTFPALIDQKYLRPGDLSFKLGADGSEVDLSQEVESITFGFQNGIPQDKAHRFGSGLYANEFSVGKREVTLSFRLRISKDNTAYLDLLKNQTAQSMVTTITGPAIGSSGYDYKIEIDTPNLQVSEYKEAESGEEIVADITAKPLYDGAFAAPFQITVMNDDVSYLI